MASEVSETTPELDRPDRQAADGRGTPMEDLYRTLELDPKATPEQVEAAYLDLVKVWHPDRFEDANLRAKAEEKVRLLNDAYRRLKDANPGPTTEPGPAPRRIAKKPARPAAPRIAVVAAPEESTEEGTRSPWELHGWATSIAAHSLLLLILAFWYFSTKPSQVRTFDTRLSGSPSGVEDGLTALGGLDTPLAMPELAPTPPTPETTFTRLQQPDVAPSSFVGLQSGAGNPGAGQGDGFGLARFGSGGEVVQGVKVKVGDPQFTLLWDTRADIDIHVIEPGGKEIFWNDPRGRKGGELDVDNVEGFGPENIYWMKQNEDGSKEIGPGPPGEYRWFVVYYGGNGGIPVPTRWKVRVKHEGRVEIFQGKLSVPGARSKTYTLTIAGGLPANGTMSDFKP